MLRTFFQPSTTVVWKAHAASAIWAVSINGMPYLNFLCRVLWCQVFIPNHAPMLPPKTANHSSVDSGMRHLLRLDFHLSMPYNLQEIHLGVSDGATV